MPQFNTNQTRTATMGAANAVTGSIFIKRGGFIKVAAGVFSLTLNLQRRNIDGVNWDTVTDNSGNVVAITTAGLYTVNPQSIQGEYRVICSAYTSGSTSVTIEGK